MLGKWANGASMLPKKSEGNVGSCRGRMRTYSPKGPRKGLGVPLTRRGRQTTLTRRCMATGGTDLKDKEETSNTAEGLPRPCQVLFTASFASEEDALFTSLSEECKEERVYDVGVLTTVGRKAERGQGHQIQSGAKRQGIPPTGGTTMITRVAGKELEFGKRPLPTPLAQQLEPCFFFWGIFTGKSTL